MIGILGGSFDPIHNGHLRTALDVLELLNLDELRFIPLNNAVHREQPTATSQQRLEMISAAVSDTPKFAIDDRELKRKTLSYTVDTLQSLRNELGEEPICLLLGSDAWAGFEQWHEPEKIRQLAHIVVMQRPGETAIASTTHNWQELHKQPAGLVAHVSVTQLAISSSEIRERIASGRSIRYLLPQSVEKLIRSAALYL